MAHLWVLPADSNGRQLGMAKLADEAEAFLLSHEVAAPVRMRGKREGSNRSAQIIHVKGTEPEVWALVAPKGKDVLVNGIPLIAGLRVLRDRDEILLQGMPRMYFSSERLARKEPFPGGGKPFICPRCKLEVEKGQEAVQCPNCGVWHHQVDEQTEKEGNLPCWTYAERCAMCHHSTDLAAGFRWMPEVI